LEVVAETAVDCRDREPECSPSLEAVEADPVRGDERFVTRLDVPGVPVPGARDRGDRFDGLRVVPAMTSGSGGLASTS